MQCRCGQNFCWACGTGYARGAKQRCRCTLYGSRLFAATLNQSLQLEQIFILVGVSLALPDCNFIAQRVAQFAPWAFALVPIPAVLRLHGWNKAAASWLVLAFAAEGILPPMSASILVVLGMAATLWTGSRHQPRVIDFDAWKTFGPVLRSLPVPVVLAVPTCTIWAMVAVTRAIAFLESQLRHLVSEDGSVPVALLPLAAVVIPLVALCLASAFLLLWHAIGINYREDAEEHAEVSLFNCVQVVALQVLAVRARLGARWILQGAFEWGLIVAVAFFWILIVIIVRESQASNARYGRAFQSMVLDLGGPRFAAAQAVALSVAFVAVAQLAFPITSFALCLQLLSVHLCWLHISRSIFPSLSELARFTGGSLLSVLIMLMLYGVPGVWAAAQAIVASSCAMHSWRLQDTHPWTVWV